MYTPPNLHIDIVGVEIDEDISEEDDQRQVADQITDELDEEVKSVTRSSSQRCDCIHQHLQKEALGLKEDVDALKVELGQWTIRRGSIEGECERLRLERNALRRDCDALRQECKILLAQYSKYKVELAALVPKNGIFFGCDVTRA
jgi:chromosome segregation ATPase